MQPTKRLGLSSKITKQKKTKKGNSNVNKKGRAAMTNPGLSPGIKKGLT
jgi:hypothetical protein